VWYNLTDLLTVFMQALEDVLHFETENFKRRETDKWLKDRIKQNFISTDKNYK
jgi:hypothetical protein